MLKLAKIQRRLQETHRVALTYDDALVDEVARRCTEVESGARNVDNILTNTMLPEISTQILGKIAEGLKPDAVHVGSRRRRRVHLFVDGIRRRPGSPGRLEGDRLPATQINRPFRIKTPLGDDALLLDSFVGVRARLHALSIRDANCWRRIPTST